MARSRTYLYIKCNNDRVLKYSTLLFNVLCLCCCLHVGGLIVGVGDLKVSFLSMPWSCNTSFKDTNVRLR